MRPYTVKRSGARAEGSLMPRCRTLLPLLVLTGALVGPAAAQAGVTEFSSGLTSSSQPADITKGPDGNLWFTQKGSPGGIGQITPAGSITEYTAGVVPGFTADQEPEQITTGPDGALWFTESGVTGQIGRFDPATDTVTEYATGITPNRQPTGIAKGPDGNLWFTERGGAGAIARITPTGMVTEYTTGLTTGSQPTDIAAGPDGNLWFTESADPGRIGRIDPGTGSITEFSYGLTPNSGPSHITSSDGALYFTQAGGAGRIGQMKTDGNVEEYTTGLTPDASPGGIAEGGDGALWFTEGTNPGRLGRLWPDSEQITEFTGGVALGLSADAGPAGITRGPDGNVWFTERGVPARIGRVTVPPRAELAKAEGLGAGAVRLKASVAPNSQPTTYFIEWGSTTGYGDQTSVLPAATVPGPVSVSTQVDLALDAHYHARVTATNASGTAVSKDKFFYLTLDGEVVREKPEVKPPSGTSTVVVPEGPPASVDPGATTPGADAAGTLSPAAPPALGHDVTVRPVSGSVFVKAPGSDHYVPLGAGGNIRVGSFVDTRNGKVSLQSARDAHGRTQQGTFWGAIFQVRQRRHDSRGVTDLVLRGGRFAGCPARRGSASASALAREAGGRRRAVRRLWGKDRHARFRTHGRDSVATVRGTEWVTTDRCDGTLTKVRAGKVLVRDLHRKRSVLLTAGHAYLARHNRH
ncbi:MAG: virginiamycin lyase [Solirubrobacteraceae bacterium]|nr:virginiamycin lyase [Solirubrobacteraceae bacterium]